MELTAVIERVRRVVDTCAQPDAGDLDVTAALAASAQVRSFLDACDAELSALLDRPGTFAEAAIVDATRCSPHEAHRRRERARTLDNAPAFAYRLRDAEITAGHVDALTRACKQLDDAQRAALLDEQDTLARRARTMAVTDFATLLKRRVRALQSDGGLDRLERQRRSTRLRTWVDGDGMWNLRGTFDPLLAKDFAARLGTATDTLFADATPDTAPDDPVEKQHHLAALALARLVEGSATSNRSGAPEYLVVIDADEDDGAGGPTVDWGIPIEVPHHVLATLLGESDPTVVVTRNGIVLHAPGRLDLGRTTRLANRAQRRALRALYPDCAIPGCGVHFDRCKIHHVVWWRHGGRTDLANLLPVCSRHHSQIHNDGWTVTLGAHRELTVTTPDGTVLTTGPPSRSPRRRSPQRPSPQRRTAA